MANEVFKNDTLVNINWNGVQGVDFYHLQVSLNLDFSGTHIFETMLLGAPGQFVTDTNDGNRKRFWRWRYTKDSGVTWNEWSEVGSYWLNTSGSKDISVPVNKWVVFGVDDLDDLYQLETFPVFKITDQAIEHLRQRNRKFELLSEYVTAKAEIVMAFEGTKMLLAEQMRAMKRFNIEHKTFFLATRINNGLDDVSHIWKVQFDDNPEFELVAQSRQDLFEGELTFIEV